jgi:competence protein ComEC
VLLVLAGAGMAAAGTRAVAVRGAVLPGLIDRGGTVVVTGRVAAEPRRLRSGGLGVTLTVTEVAASGGGRARTRERAGLILDPADGPVELGDRLVVRAGVRAARQGDPLGRMPIADLRRPTVLARAPSRSPLVTVTARIRADARRRALEALPVDQAGLLTGLGLGDTSLLPGDVEADFDQAGLSHLMAVSGANVAVVLAAGLWPLLLAGAGRRTAALAGVAMVAGFVVLTRAEPSVLRAGVMAVAALAGVATGRGPGGRRALCLAVVVLLLFDPALVSSLGFLLSAGATAGVLWAGPAAASWLPERLPYRVRQGAGMSLGAQAGALPILACAVGEFTPASLPANLVVLPVATGPMLLGLVAALTGPILPPVSRLACHLASPFVAVLLWVARHAADLSGPGHALTGWARAAPAAVVLALVVLHTLSRARQARALRVVAGGR